MEQVYRSSNRVNLRRAFQFAQQRYGIAQLIDAEGNETSFSSVSPVRVFRRRQRRTRREKSFALHFSSLQSLSNFTFASVRTSAFEIIDFDLFIISNSRVDSAARAIQPAGLGTSPLARNVS